MSSTFEKKILHLAESSVGVTPRDLEAEGIPRYLLYRLHRKGLIERAARGLYFLPGVAPSENRTLAEVAKKFPEGVICLLSALQFHGLTTQMPHQVWLAIEPTKRRPKNSGFPIRLLTFSGEAYNAGIEIHKIEDMSVKMYNPAKTVADCFKFRKKFGLDLALEALRDCREQRKCTYDDLYRYAKICRVWNVMRPYLEAVT